MSEHANRMEAEEPDTNRETSVKQFGAGAASLDLYLRDINRHPLLSREEEAEVARRIRAGDRAALDLLVAANLRFVVTIAKQYSNQGLSLEDLINEGNIGLIKAARRFDPERGFKFISYAVWWIRQGVLQALAEQSRIVRLPLNRVGTLYRIGKVSRRLDQELGRSPTADEIAAQLNMTAAEVEEAAMISSPYLSLDDPVSANQDDTWVDRLPAEGHEAPDQSTYASALSADLGRALDTLTDRQREVLIMYFGLGRSRPMTLDEIGSELKLTRERIRQIREAALKCLRHSHRTGFLRGHVEGQH